MKRAIGCGALALLLVAACTTTPRRPAVQSVTPTPTSVEALAAAIAADSARSDHEPDAKARDELAAAANRDADACLTLDPHAAACLYWHAVAMGLDAKAHPTRAVGLLKGMLEALAAADAADPNYDRAGPARVRALVLVRAPGWPLGPGDADAGSVAARRAVTLQPQYPPNLLALAEALAKTDDADGARENYTLARDIARALPASADRDDWVRQAEHGLQK